jgi:hypothetical protein
VLVLIEIACEYPDDNNTKLLISFIQCYKVINLSLPPRAYLSRKKISQIISTTRPDNLGTCILRQPVQRGFEASQTSTPIPQSFAHSRLRRHFIRSSMMRLNSSSISPIVRRQFRPRIRWQLRSGHRRQFYLRHGRKLRVTAGRKDSLQYPAFPHKNAKPPSNSNPPIVVPTAMPVMAL